MTKTNFKPGTMIYPLPAVMVSCGNAVDGYNIITLSWVGTINSDPAMCSISVRKNRYSHLIISKNKEFFINLTNQELAFATDWCGVKSGRDIDKFKQMNLHPMHIDEIAAPYIAEAPLSIACKVKQVIELGSHDMFIAEVAAVLADNKYIDPKSDAFDFSKAGLITYCHGNYYTLGEKIGKFGWSVEKKKKKK